MQAMMRMAGAVSQQARDGDVSTVLVSGHRLVYASPRTAQIIDVDKETITDVSLEKKTYSVMTFAQLKQMMDDMAKSMGQGQPELRYKTSLKNTGQSKAINGLTARQVMLTVSPEGQSGMGAMEMTSDVWVAPVAGYEEVRNFYKMFAAKAGMMPGQGMGMAAMQPGMLKAMAESVKEISNLDGAPVQMVMRYGSAGTTMAGQQPAPPPAGQTPAEQSSAEAVARLRGMGGFPGAGGQPLNTNGVFMEITTDQSGFSTTKIDPAKFEIPAGYNQVEPETGRRGGRRR